MSTNSGRLPGIEGLRAIAACSILVYHAWLFSSPAKPGWNLGPVTVFVPPLQSGVTLFFVLSGFLLYRPISDALLHGRPLPSISRYLRSRALRILPAYWTVLLITGLAGTTILGASQSGLRVGPPRDVRVLLEDALLVANYRPSTMWTGVLPAWSLTIEIAFYLALPALAVMAAALARRGDRNSRTRAALVPIATLFGVGLIGKVAAALFVPGPGRSGASDWHAVLERSLLTHADLFAFGMLAALVLSLHSDGTLRIPPTLLGGVGGRLLLYVGAPFGVLGYYTLSPYVYDSVVALILAALLTRVLASAGAGNPSRLLALLERRSMIRIGLASYSIFLWNYPVLSFLKVHDLLFLQDNAAAILANVLLAACVTGALSFVTYRYIELPFLQLKVRSRQRPVLVGAD